MEVGDSAVTERGTAVRLNLTDPLSPLTDPGYLEGAIRRHYEPLLDPACDAILGELYPRGVSFEVNGEALSKQACRAPETAPLAIHTGRRRKPSALGYLYREAALLPEDQRGVAVSTYGKIIKRRWDWLGITPNSPERIGGLIEFPMLAASLTLNKGDFIRTGQRGAAYLAARKAIQEVVQRQLAAWGDAREHPETARPRSMRSLERDLERVLRELSEGFPLLASLVEHRRGGQKSLPLGPTVEPGGTAGFDPALALSPMNPPGSDDTDVPPSGGPSDAPRADRPEASPPENPLAGGASPAPRGERRPTRLGLAVQFEDRPGDSELGRLVESTVYVNRAHPAYRRAAASRSEGYHVALALAPLAVEPAKEHAFVTAFLSCWGEAVSAIPSRRRKS